METIELETRIDNEEYFVHSYGNEEFYSFWEGYEDESIENYELAVVLYDFITTQMKKFSIRKNFVIAFSTEPGSKLTQSAVNMCKEFYGTSGLSSKKHYIRAYGRLDNAPLCPVNLEIRVDNSQDIYNFTLDDYNELPPKVNLDYINTRDEKYGDLTLAGKIEGSVLYINNILYANERDREVVLYEGANYMHEGQSLSMNLFGYETGKIEKIIFKFSEYDAVNHVGVDSVVSTYIMFNNSSSDVYDGFYDTNCHPCPSIKQSFGADMITKSFNLDVNGVLTGYSSNDSKTNLIVLRSVTAIIDQKYWKTNEVKDNIKLNDYKLILATEIDANEDDIYLKDEKRAYDIYSLSMEELEKFKELYKNKN